MDRVPLADMTTNMIHSRKLLYFVAVAEEKHFGRAANRLAISQPPLSEHIQELERDLGSKLLIRSTRSVQLTKAGEALLIHARKVLSEIDKCRTLVQSVADHASSTIELGVLHAHTYSFLPELLRAYFEKSPQINVQLREYSTREQIPRLLNDEGLDMGIVREPVSHPGLIVHRLFEEPYVLAVPDHWNLNENGPISIQSMRDQTMIGYPSHDSLKSTSRLFSDFLSQHNVPLSNRLELTTMHAALAIVASGKGFAPVPLSQTRLAFPLVRYVALNEPAPILAVGLARRDVYMPPHLLEFIDFCIEYFANQRPSTVQFSAP